MKGTGAPLEPGRNRLPQRAWKRRARPWALACRSRCGAALLLLVARAAAAGPHPPRATPRPADAAQPASAQPDRSERSSRRKAAFRAFEGGRQLQDEQRFAEALAKYERAYELLPSQTVLYRIAAMHVKLGEWASAHGAFSTYLRLDDGSLSPERLAQVDKYLRALEKRIATLNLALNVPGARVSIDGVELQPTEVSGVVVDAGLHTLRVSKPGFRPLERKLNAPAGQILHVILPLAPTETLEAVTPPPPPADSQQPDPLPGWVPWAITGACAAAWGTLAVLAVRADRARDEIEQPSSSTRRIERARNLHLGLALASDVMLLSTLVSAGVSAKLTWWKGPEASPAGGGRVQTMSLSLSGRF